jgi:hypothetical protein
MGLTHVQTAEALWESPAGRCGAIYWTELRNAMLQVDVAIGATFIAKALGGSVEDPGLAAGRLGPSAVLPRAAHPWLAEADQGRALTAASTFADKC